MLDLNPGLMLFVLVIFFSLMYLLNTMLYQPLLKFMDDREATIANDLKNAEEMADNSSDLNAKANALLADAKAEANAIREKATSEAKALAESKIESKVKELDENSVAFLAELDTEQETLKNALVAELPAFKETLQKKLSSL
ncbi:MAG: ATP synthase subunit b [uncultured Sulfurovum sp.]|uniref:ATP synthase subunit b n=1 Tax=uncultured Sulfurovum sp. TaxID=269237 RepID=A0A6S6TLG0_9BACT|nr:MAG: ATP synthase subunit b [uncultured Sulfurovum sp.]